jgi:hypothetical protein
MMKLLTPIAFAIAALVASPAFAADAKKTAAVECADAAAMPKAKSEKSREEVKKEAKGAATECEGGTPVKASSTKDRKQVKEETAKAVKEGTIPQGEAMEAKKKP